MFGFTPPGRRERLIEAGVQLFADRGYRGVGVPDIVRQAGVALTSFYSSFESKRHFANVAYRAASVEVEQQVEAIALGEGDARERFHELWLGLLSVPVRVPHAFTFLQTLDLSFFDQENLERDRVPLALCQHLADPVLAAALKPQPARLLGACLWGTLIEVDKGVIQNTFPLTKPLAFALGDCLRDALFLPQDGSGPNAGTCACGASQPGGSP